jgi:ABC-2 type transport system permease protein
MFLIGIYILPKVGLPELQIGDNFLLLALMSVVCAVAGVSFGLMIGSLASSHEQSASFGSIIVVIMAAMGGIWVPSFVMPPIFQLISSFSPMNWALNGFYDILLRDSGFIAISGYLIKLLLFALIAFGVAVATNLKLYKTFYD